MLYVMPKVNETGLDPRLFFYPIAVSFGEGGRDKSPFLGGGVGRVVLSQ